MYIQIEMCVNYKNAIIIKQEHANVYTKSLVRIESL